MYKPVELSDLLYRLLSTVSIDSKTVFNKCNLDSDSVTRGTGSVCPADGARFLFISEVEKS